MNWNELATAISEMPLGAREKPVLLLSDDGETWLEIEDDKLCRTDELSFIMFANSNDSDESDEDREEKEVYHFIPTKCSDIDP